MKKRFFFIFLALVLVVGAIAGIKVLQIRTMIKHGGGNLPPETVSSAVAERQAWEVTIKAVGSLEAVQGVTVASELAGKVSEISFEPGATVQAGDLLVQLDIASEQAQLRAAEASAALAKINLDRLAGLIKKQTIARSEFDTAEATYKQAAAQADAIRAAIAKKTIRAPFAGRLGVRQVNLGQILSDGSPVVTLQRLDPVFVNFLLPQQDLPRVKTGYLVLLTADALTGHTISGTLTTISPEVDSATRNFRIQATVANKEDLLRPGMYVEIAVVLPTKKDVLAIPATAVLNAPYGDSVFIIEESGKEKAGKAGKVLRQQFVRLGDRQGDFVEVTSGLKRGETVAATGVFKLRNGQAVVIDNSLKPPFKLAPHPPNE